MTDTFRYTFRTKPSSKKMDDASEQHAKRDKGNSQQNISYRKNTEQKLKIQNMLETELINQRVKQKQG